MSCPINEDIIRALSSRLHICILVNGNSKAIVGIREAFDLALAPSTFKMDLYEAGSEGINLFNLSSNRYETIIDLKKDLNGLKSAKKGMSNV